MHNFNRFQVISLVKINGSASLVKVSNSSLESVELSSSLKIFGDSFFLSVSKFTILFSCFLGTIFFIQIFFTLLFVYGALKLGPSALVAWVTVQALIANLFVLKQIHLFGMEVTASDGYAIGSLLGLNVLQEFYGKKEAKQATWICFFFMTFFALASQLHLYYIPSSFDTAQTAFITVLSPSLRLIFASMSVFFIVQLFDIRFFAFLKQKLPTVSFSIRAALALIVSQFLHHCSTDCGQPRQLHGLEGVLSGFVLDGVWVESRDRIRSNF